MTRSVSSWLVWDYQSSHSISIQISSRRESQLTARVKPNPVIFRSVGKEASKQAESLSSSCEEGGGLALGLIGERTDEDIISFRVNRENSPDFEHLQAQINALR